VRAIILVGGEGTRLRPLTYSVPKQMLPVVEVPMIERVTSHLVHYGVTDVVLSLGYRPDAFLAAYPTGHCGGATVSYAVEPELLDTAGAVRFAAKEAGIDGTFLVVNGDVLSDLDVGKLIDFHRASGAEGTISLTPVEDPSHFGVVPVDGRGRVEAFIEKPAPGTAPTNLINAGTYVLEPSVLDRIDGGRRVNIERETFPAMVADGGLYALASDGYWLDVGTPERYVQASIDLLSGRRAEPPTPDAVETAPHVWHRGTPLLNGEIEGPAWVGDRAIVGEGARVERAVIAAGATVSAGATISGSVVLAGAVVSPGALVRDSILGPGAVVGAGASVVSGSVIGNGADVPIGAHLSGQRFPS
jgi:mannose-1-phosphate guanylyltransferase